MRYAIIPSVAFLLVSACASTGAPSSNKELSGMDMYVQLCSSCHGASGHGDGPVSSLIKIGVPDLTRIAQRDGGEFNTEDVRRAIDGRWDRRAHGARDMPVWGWQLYDSSAADDNAERAQVDSMISRLVDYLRSIQAN
ncbi:MAG TPA: cytochrome c [Steroidobacteraceae bacterium]|jgi:mono/diheme cytochrome c family protein|nr:cytochrome c [Steroidobacteraceae bacterium]